MDTQGVFKAVLWDMDGVVINSNIATWKATNALLAHHNLAEDTFEQFLQRPHNQVTWYTERGILAEAEVVKDLFYKFYVDSGYDLIDGAREVLVEL